MELLHYLLPELPSWAKWINYLVFLLGTIYLVDSIGARFRKS